MKYVFQMARHTTFYDDRYRLSKVGGGGGLEKKYKPRHMQEGDLISLLSFL
jgi:hypothetical protein